jgi:uncharacterized protein DUF5681
MPFEQGESGNPAGRPKGSQNKATKELREKICQFLLDNFARVQEEFNNLEGKDKVKFYCDLLPFGLARIKPSDDNTLDRLTDTELNDLFEKLKDVANRQIQDTEAET